MDQQRRQYLMPDEGEGLGYQRAYLPEYVYVRNMIDAVLGRAGVVADGTLGLRVMQLAEAAYASARTNRPANIEP